MFFVRILPLGIVGLIVGTTCVTFYLSYVKYHHVTYILPYMSDTGTFPPESCIFGQALNIGAVLIAFAIYIKFLQVHEMYQRHHIEEKFNLNKIALFAGILTCTGLSIVANFQETNLFLVHWFGAILTFGGGSFYLGLQTLQYIKISPIIGQRKTTMFRIVLSVVTLISFFTFFITGIAAYRKFTGDDVTKWKKEEGGYSLHQISTIAEWICAAAAMIFLSLLHQEFKIISVKPLSISFEEHKSSNNINI